MKQSEGHDRAAAKYDELSVAEELTVRHDGVAFAVIAAGQGPAVLLLHGGGSRADYFRDLIARLSGESRVVAYDQRSFGRSEIAPDTAVDHDHWASDVVGIMDALGIDKATLVGWSMGASVAINAAYGWPERVERLILLGGPDPARGVDVARLRERQASAAAATAAATKARDRMELAAAVGPAARNRPDLVERLVEDRAATPPNRVALAIGGYASRPELAPRLSAISCPVTIIGGTEDPISTPAVTARLASHLPQAEMVMLEGCGHYHVAEEPERIAGIVLSELRKSRA